MKKLILTLLIIVPLILSGQTILNDAGDWFELYTAGTNQNNYSKNNYQIIVNRGKVGIENLNSGVDIASPRDFDEWVVDGNTFASAELLIDAIAPVIYASFSGGGGSGECCIILDGQAIIDTCTNDTLQVLEAQTLVLGAKDDTSQALGITNGNTVYIDIRDQDSDDTNELQSLTQLTDSSFVISETGDTIIIHIPPTSDDQQISISNDTIYLEDGGFVVLPESGDSALWEYTAGDTIETINKSSITNVFGFYSQTDFGQLLNGRFNVGGGNYIPALGAQASAYGISAIVGMISIQPFAGDSLLIQAGYARNGTESVGLFITPSTDQTRLTSRRELKIDPHHMTAEFDSTVNETYTNLRTIADTIHRTVDYLNNQVNVAEYKRIGSTYSELHVEDTTYYNNDEGLVFDFTGIGSGKMLRLNLDNSKILSMNPQLINWTSPINRNLIIGISGLMNDTARVFFPRRSGEMLVDSSLILATEVSITNNNFFTGITNDSNIVKYSFSDVYGSIVDSFKSLIGYATYQDTSSADLVIAVNDTAQVLIKPDIVDHEFSPVTIDSLWKNYKINGEDGATYIVRLDFTGESSSDTGYASLLLDIGANDNSPVIITNTTITFPRGANNPNQFSLTTWLYAKDTFETNGCKVKFLSEEGTTTISNVSISIDKISQR